MVGHTTGSVQGQRGRLSTVVSLMSVVCDGDGA